VCACAPKYQNGDVLRGEDACARLDTFLAAAFPRPLEMRGRATFDVESYRVRGRFVLTATPSGDAVFEFSGATLLGGHREDAVFSMSGDTLRVLDRERGRYYEGAEVERLMERGTGTSGDWRRGLRRVLASGCDGIETLQAGEDGVSGAAVDGPYSLRAADGRLEAATWPNPAPEDTFRDRLEVRYRWSHGRLEEIEARLPTRGWRVRLEAD
jgi:hypothetical protein